MAQIRTVFNDAQFFDQDLTPTFVSATTFTVPGDQTSAIHAGRRLKLFDASTMYATVTTANFSVVTTITVAVDSGTSLTGSLSSFALSIISSQNPALPEGMSISAAALNISGALSVGGNLVVTGTLSASSYVAPNIPKAWVTFSATTAGVITTLASFNVASVSRSAAGVYRINFTTALTDASYAWTSNQDIASFSSNAAFFKMTGGTDGLLTNFVFYR